MKHGHGKFNQVDILNFRKDLLIKQPHYRLEEFIVSIMFICLILVL